MANLDNNITKTDTGLNWIFKMAWRDGKASVGKLILFVASIVLGIAAVVAIQSFGDNLKKNIALQSKSLMGADFIINSSKPVNERVSKIIDSLGGANGREIGFASMAAFPKNDAAKLVQVRGIEGGFPFYGELETNPTSAGKTYQQTNGALVDATVMLQNNIRVGDSIKIGGVTLPVAGALKSVPGSNAIFSSVAPPVLIPYRFIEQTGLVQTGSRIDYKYYFVAPDKNMERLDHQLDPALDAQGADLDTHTSTSRRLGRRYENFAKFLNLIAFIALLLGCVGIASAVHIYIKDKLRAVAVLKCLGATRRQTFFIYLVQIAFIGLLGGLIGTVAGVFLQQLFPVLLQDLLPIDIEVSFAPKVILLGLLLGLLMSILFALYPLMGTLYVSPLEALRVNAKGASKSKTAGFLVLAVIFLFIFLFAFWLLKDLKYSLAFVAGILVTFAILAGVANVFMRIVKRFFPTSWGFVARQGLLNLFRPNNQTLILVMAIGVGTFLISTLYFSKDLLLSQAALDKQKKSPNMILLDVQNDQREAVAGTVRADSLPVLENIPIVTMRVQGINGRSATSLKNDPRSNVGRWVLNHEFRVTYRDSLIASESLTAGTWDGTYADDGLVPISVSDNFAGDAKVKVGDQVTFNVQGKSLKTRVASVRLVDWSRMQLNFSIVFPKGVLEQAPQFLVITTKVPSEKASAALQQKLVKRFPNVTILDLRQVLSVIESLLNKISWLINFMAFFSIITGIIVLIGAVRTSKYQRIKESVLLRTLGAKSVQILKIMALEYVYLGILGSFAGIALSLIGSQLLAWLVFDAVFVPSWIPFFILFPGITILVVIIGLANSVGVIKNPPLQVLRKEV